MWLKQKDYIRVIYSNKIWKIEYLFILVDFKKETGTELQSGAVNHQTCYVNIFSCKYYVRVLWEDQVWTVWSESSTEEGQMLPSLY